MPECGGYRPAVLLLHMFVDAWGLIAITVQRVEIFFWIKKLIGLVNCICNDFCHSCFCGM
jgi:hypothetical protein